MKLSDEDLAGMGRAGDLDAEADRILATLPDHTGLVVITEGARGARLLNRAARVSVPAAPVSRVIDTVGAGDCFEAGLLTALLGACPTSTALPSSMQTPCESWRIRPHAPPRSTSSSRAAAPPIAWRCMSAWRCLHRSPAHRESSPQSDQSSLPVIDLSAARNGA